MIKLTFGVPEALGPKIFSTLHKDLNGRTTETAKALDLEIAKLGQALEPNTLGVNDSLRKLFQIITSDRNDGTSPDAVLEGLKEHKGQNSLSELGIALESHWRALSDKFQTLASALKNNSPAKLSAALTKHFGGFDMKNFLENITPGNQINYEQDLGLQAK